MALVKRSKVTFKSEEESGKLHPDVGNQYSLTLPYSRDLLFWELELELRGDRTDIPHPNDPNDLVGFQIAEIQPRPKGIITFLFGYFLCES